ncbi:hypothetical protein EMIHUDRAFT_231037 [Emiliania huxleyi CCMP1516]|uniref:Right handed beta helix domain-containing protein n=2 Tax=Emiliania huxleyi TaxID=2903 RepID=A0A0D3K955_EMIH1|nr:hypothetical protein EMIHUDRAFT_231037 [Emiliania huxleyi CCMP1516]EOD32290.1 hypothetical protein EMIHUDRAFT_231037 [Emiliania huxleyi CCMP1516]|eukprot:XP_005784719.1 hypothetical protein EMIHUDRAFT_231037 [Emiliania huxleyi CCMP1516]
MLGIPADVQRTIFNRGSLGGPRKTSSAFDGCRGGERVEKLVSVELAGYGAAGSSAHHVPNASASLGSDACAEAAHKEACIMNECPCATSESGDANVRRKANKLSEFSLEGDSAHAWDEGVALHAGLLEPPPVSDRNFLHPLAEALRASGTGRAGGGTLGQSRPTIEIAQGEKLLRTGARDSVRAIVDAAATLGRPSLREWWWCCAPAAVLLLQACGACWLLLGQRAPRSGAASGQRPSKTVRPRLSKSLGSVALLLLISALPVARAGSGEAGSGEAGSGEAGSGEQGSGLWGVPPSLPPLSPPVLCEDGSELIALLCPYAGTQLGCDTDLHTVNPAAPEGSILSRICPASCGACEPEESTPPSPPSTPIPPLLVLCEDDPGGLLTAWLTAYRGCAFLTAGLVGCDTDLHTINPAAPVGSTMSLICPASCGACESEEITPLSPLLVAALLCEDDFFGLAASYGGCTFFLTFGCDFDLHTDIRDEINKAVDQGRNASVYVPPGVRLAFSSNVACGGDMLLSVRSSGEGATLDGKKSSNMFSIFGGCSLYLEALHFVDGVGDYGGAVLALGAGDIAMKGVSFTGCEANQEGGGMFVWDSGDVSLERASFSKCTAVNRGGGMSVWNSGDVSLESASFSECTTTLYGGGMNVDNSGDVSLHGASFSECTAGDDGGGMRVWKSGDVSLESARFVRCTSVQAVPRAPSTRGLFISMASIA